MDEYKESLEYARQFVEAAAKYGDSLLIGMAQMTLGSIHYGQRDLAPAVQAMEAALAILEQSGMAGMIMTAHLSLGSVYLEQKQYERARQEFQTSLALAEKAGDVTGVGTAISSLAALEFDLKNYERSLQLATRLHELASRYPKTSDLLPLSQLHLAVSLHELGRPQEALPWIEQAVAGYRKVGRPRTLVESLFRRGRIYETLGRVDEAIADLREAVELVEKIAANVTGDEKKRFEFREKDIQIYETLIRLLMKKGLVEESFEYLERSKSKALVTALRVKSIQARDPELSSLLEQVGAMRDRIGALESHLDDELSKPLVEQDLGQVRILSKSLDAGSAALESLVEDVRGKNPLAVGLIAVRRIAAKNVQQRIPQGTLLVEYFPTTDALYIYLIRRDSVDVRKVDVPAKALDEAVWEFRRVIEGITRKGGFVRPIESWKESRSVQFRSEVAPVKKALTQLYAWLIGPVWEEIERHESVMFVPTGTLYYLPFGALARELPDGELKFLVEEKQISILPSAEMLELSQNHRSGNGGLVAFGNPDGSLPAAAEEVQQIAGIMPQSQVFIGPDATEDRLAEASRGASILHLATHGVLSDRDVNQSYIVMAPATGEGMAKDGRLRLGEIYGLPVPGGSRHVVGLRNRGGRARSWNRGNEFDTGVRHRRCSGHPGESLAGFRSFDCPVDDGVLPGVGSRTVQGSGAAPGAVDRLEEPKVSAPLFLGAVPAPWRGRMSVGASRDAE